MIALVFEFDGVQPAVTLDLFDRLPQALAGRSVHVDYRPVAPPAGEAVVQALQALATCRPPGRFACGEVLRGAPGAPGPGVLPAASGPVPAILWQGRRFVGHEAIERLLDVLPPP